MRLSLLPMAGEVLRQNAKAVADYGAATQTPPCLSWSDDEETQGKGNPQVIRQVLKTLLEEQA